MNRIKDMIIRHRETGAFSYHFRDSKKEENDNAVPDQSL